jgi:hypothetical protein
MNESIGISQPQDAHGAKRCARLRRYADGAPLSSLARDASQIQPSRTYERAKGARSGPVGQPAQGRPCVGRGAASAMCVKAWRTETAALLPYRYMNDEMRGAAVHRA